MKKAPEKEKKKEAKELRRGVIVYSKAGSDTDLLIASGPDTSQTILGVPSISVYDWMDDVRKTLGREPRMNVDESCIELLGIGQTDPFALEIDVKVNQECASVPEGEASHTDPSPFDDTDSWVLCKSADSGGGQGDPSGGPDGGSPGGGPDGGDPSASADSSGDSGNGSTVLDSIQDIICTPAVGGRPDVDPRLVYPDPNKTGGMIVELAPCIMQFCPWKLIPIPFDPEDDPSDPKDPSPEDDPELDEATKEKLPCDKIKNLCEPDITLITKNDLVKEDGDDDSDGDKPEGACDDTCDGVCEGQAGESCKDGDVGSKEEDWVACGGTEIAPGSVCVEHKKNDKGQNEYTVTHGNGVPGKRPPIKEQAAREKEAQDMASAFSDGADCTTGGIQSNADENKTSFTITCN